MQNTHAGVGKFDDLDQIAQYTEHTEHLAQKQIGSVW